MRASKPRTPSPPSTGRRMTVMLIAFAVVFGGVFALWFASQRLLNNFFDNMPQPAVEVSTFEARGERWNDAAKREAIEQAAGIRLRPVLMTTAALVFAMVPLLIAKGPGASARFSLGTVIASGMTIGTAFTLFVLPAMYLYLARDHSHDRAAAAEEGTGLEPQAG